MVIIIVLMLLALFAFIVLKQKHKTQEHGDSRMQNKKSSQDIELTISMPSEIDYKMNDDWKLRKESEERFREEEIERITASFVAPSTLAEAIVGLENSVEAYATTWGVPTPDFKRILSKIDTTDPKKTNDHLKKAINKSYKLRDDPASMVDTLAMCAVHIQLSLIIPDEKWDLKTSVQRLCTNLRDEKYRHGLLGVITRISEDLGYKDLELAEFCREQVKRTFRYWFYDEKEKSEFNANVKMLPLAGTVWERHVILTNLIDYLSKRRKQDPSMRDHLLAYCEADILDYRDILMRSNRVGNEGLTFEQIRHKKDYICPVLPSFDAAWSIYSEEGNREQLERLKEIANLIKYEHCQFDESADHLHSDNRDSEKLSRTPCPVEIIEVNKSKKNGKSQFIDDQGNECSTEEAAAHHFKRLGYRVIRGEVRFWQAMFGLSFWEEIFEGTGTPNSLDDIPFDLFKGSDFYAARKERIDQKYSFLSSANIDEYLTRQLKKYGHIWTRIIFENSVGDFSYHDSLASQEVTNFLKVIDSKIFAKIVYRIAKNPGQNRSGLPDYCIWNDRELIFIEVKGIRENVRDSQLDWLTWLHAEGIPAKIVRLKGKINKE